MYYKIIMNNSWYLLYSVHVHHTVRKLLDIIHNVCISLQNIDCLMHVYVRLYIHCKAILYVCLAIIPSQDEGIAQASPWQTVCGSDFVF